MMLNTKGVAIIERCGAFKDNNEGVHRKYVLLFCCNYLITQL